jgi:pyruvate dehydrogenase E2 component (dihydrolipoamide acetyltransferase)
VTIADIERAARERKARPAKAPSAPSAPAAQPRGDHERERPEPRAAMRKAIAAAMSRSKREIPHYYLSETIPMAAALDWLRQRNESVPIAERVLPAVVLLKAVAQALRRTPQLERILPRRRVRSVGRRPCRRRDLAARRRARRAGDPRRRRQAARRN